MKNRAESEEEHELLLEGRESLQYSQEEARLLWKEEKCGDQLQNEFSSYLQNWNREKTKEKNRKEARVSCVRLWYSFRSVSSPLFLQTKKTTTKKKKWAGRGEEKEGEEQKQTHNSTRSAQLFTSSLTSLLRQLLTLREKKGEKVFFLLCNLCVLFLSSCFFLPRQPLVFVSFFLNLSVSRVSLVFFVFSLCAYFPRLHFVCLLFVFLVSFSDFHTPSFSFSSFFHCWCRCNQPSRQALESLNQSGDRCAAQISSSNFPVGYWTNCLLGFLAFSWKFHLLPFFAFQVLMLPFFFSSLLWWSPIFSIFVVASGFALSITAQPARPFLLSYLLLGSLFASFLTSLICLWAYNMFTSDSFRAFLGVVTLAQFCLQVSSSLFLLLASLAILPFHCCSLADCSCLLWL